MKTIVHIELSDSDRNDLARRIDREDTKRLVTRKEVTEYTLALIDQEIKDGRDDQTIKADPEPEGKGDGDSGQRGERGRTGRVSDDALTRALDNAGVPELDAFTPSRGDEDYLASPTDPGIAAACSRILDDTALIEEFAWETIERNRSK